MFRLHTPLTCKLLREGVSDSKLPGKLTSLCETQYNATEDTCGVICSLILLVLDVDCKGAVLVCDKSILVMRLGVTDTGTFPAKALTNSQLGLVPMTAIAFQGPLYLQI